MADSSDRIALPIRVHEFLLACAGRIDDDALTDARELLAVAELDRAIELLAASLVAGRIPVTADERDELRDLVDAVRSAPALVDRIIVNDSAPFPRHRFTAGLSDDPAPDAGIADAVGRVIEVLPDIRALSCVWRTTPAGGPSGSVPHRLVLVETGPSGFAPSTAYRVEQSLRRAGIRASVEVIAAGSEVTPYHADALAVARRISLRQAAVARSPEPAEPADGYDDPPSPRPVTTTRRRSGAHAEKRPPDTASGRWQQRIASSADSPAPAEPAAASFDAGGRQRHEPAMTMPPPAPSPASPGSRTGLPPVSPPTASAGSRTGLPPASPPASRTNLSPATPPATTRSAQASRSALPPVSPPTATQGARTNLPPVAPPPSAPGSRTGLPPVAPPSSRTASRTGLSPVDPPALAAENGTRSRPAPASASAAEPVKDTPVQEAPAAKEATVDKAAADAEADLSNRERELLRQLHEELAKREQSEPAEAVAPSSPQFPVAPPAPAERADPGTWQVDRTGTRHSAYSAGPAGSAWQHSAAEQTAVNGIPPYGSQPG